MPAPNGLEGKERRSFGKNDMSKHRKNDKTELEKMLERKLAEEKEAASGNTVSHEDNETVVENKEAADEKEAQDAATLAQQLAERAAECEQLKDQLLRVRADFDNYRKRMLREMDQLRQTASANLVRALLPALDNLERALAHASVEDGFVEGVGMVFKQFQEALASEGLEPIPALHEVFDPNVHDALATVPSETVESGRIVEEYERGYRLRDLVVRPARVIVSSGVPETTECSDEPENETANINNTTEQDMETQKSEEEQ